MGRTGSTVVWVAPAGTSSDGGIGDTRRETEGRSDVRRASEPPDVFAGSLADVVDPTPSSMSGTSSRSRKFMVDERRGKRKVGGDGRLVFL